MSTSICICISGYCVILRQQLTMYLVMQKDLCNKKKTYTNWQWNTTAVLPLHSVWMTFLENLHVHIACVMEQLLCSFYPIFLCTCERLNELWTDPNVQFKFYYSTLWLFFLYVSSKANSKKLIQPWSWMVVNICFRFV